MKISCDNCAHTRNQPIGRFCWNCYPGSSPINWTPAGCLHVWAESGLGTKGPYRRWARDWSPVEACKKL